MSETGQPMHSEAAQRSKSAKPDVKCRWCPTRFQQRRSWQHFCSPKCRNDWHSAMRPEAVMEARELVRLGLEGCDPAIWNPRARKLLGIK